MRNRERFSGDVDHFEKRAAELEQASSKLFETFEGVEKLGQKLEVVGTKEIRDINR